MIGSSFSQASLIWFSTSPGDGAAWAGSRGARTTSTAAMTPHAVTRPVRQRLGRDRATVNGEGPLPTWFTDTAHPTLAMHHHPIQARYYYLGQKVHPTGTDPYCPGGGRLPEGQGARQDRRDVPLGDRSGCGGEQSLLFHRPGHERVDVVFGVAHRTEPVGDADGAHQVGQDGGQPLVGPGGRGRQRRSEQVGGREVAVRTGREGEAERLRRGERDRHPVRYEWLRGRVPGRVEVAHATGDGVRVCVRRGYPGGAEAQSG